MFKLRHAEPLLAKKINGFSYDDHETVHRLPRFHQFRIWMYYKYVADKESGLIQLKASDTRYL